MLIIDPASGAMWRIEKQSQEIYETLTKSTASTKEPTLRIIDLNDLPENMKKDLVRIK